MRKFVIVVVALVTLLGTAGAAGADPLATRGTERFIAGKGQGHFHGLECAANASPVIGNFLGVTCAADVRP